MTTSGDLRFRKAGEYATRKIGGETIVVPIRSNVADLESIYTFNEVGGAVWTRLDAEKSVREIAREIAEEFDVTEEAATEDVRRFLATLSEEGLVEGRD
jgi:hypothetical protein